MGKLIGFPMDLVCHRSSPAGLSRKTRDARLAGVCITCTGGPDWDRFNEGQFRCRDMRNSQFIDSNNCSYMSQDDDRWPNEISKPPNTGAGGLPRYINWRSSSLSITYANTSGSFAFLYCVVKSPR